MLFGVIYKIECLANGKIYIGQTILKNPIIRIRKHFHKSNSIDLVYRSVNKYGMASIKWEIIASARSREDLDYLEKYFISYYNSRVPNGFNIKDGGINGEHAEESKKKIGDIRRGKPSPIKGIPKSLECRKRMSEVRKGFTSENRRLAAKRSGEKRRKKLIAENIKTKERLEFHSVNECCEKLNLISSCVIRVCNGDQNRTQHKGWRFEYVDSDTKPLPLRDDTYLGIIKNKHNKYVVILNSVYYGSFPELDIALKVKQLVSEQQVEELDKYLNELLDNKLITIWKKTETNFRKKKKLD